MAAEGTGRAAFLGSHVSPPDPARGDFFWAAKTAQIRLACLLTFSSAANAGIVVTDGDIFKLPVGSLTPACSYPRERYGAHPGNAVRRTRSRKRRCYRERALAEPSARLKELLGVGQSQILREGCDAHGRTKAGVAARERCGRTDTR